MTLEQERIKGWVEEPNLLLDIGANEGESILEYREIWPNCEIISFEPRPSAVKKLMVCAEQAGTKVLPFALGDKNEIMKITEYPSHPGGSSFLSFTAYHKDTRKWSADSRDVEVPVCRLDDVLVLSVPTVIKVDVEGFAARVIKGGTNAFRWAYAVIVEICKNPRYVGGATLPEITALLEPMGFELHGVAADHLDWMNTVWK